MDRENSRGQSRSRVGLLQQRPGWVCHKERADAPSAVAGLKEKMARHIMRAH
jgi:hypothetical protein